MNEKRPDARCIRDRVQQRIVLPRGVITSEWSAPPAPAAAGRDAPFDLDDEVSSVADHLPVDAEYRSERAVALIGIVVRGLKTVNRSRDQGFDVWYIVQRCSPDHA